MHAIPISAHRAPVLPVPVDEPAPEPAHPHHPPVPNPAQDPPVPDHNPQVALRGPGPHAVAPVVFH